MRPVVQLPEPLRKEGASALERRVLDAASRETPAEELRARMAAAIGIADLATPPLPETPASIPEPAPSAPLTQVAAKVGARAWLPWLGGATAIAALAASFARPSALPPGRAESAAVSVPAASLSVVATSRSSGSPRVTQLSKSEALGSSQVSAEPIAPRKKITPNTPDLEQQIALIDRARSALLTGEGNTALKLARQYETSYPSGSFVPEAKVLKIEALVKQGRLNEARTLAAQFLTRYPNSPLTARVQRANSGR